MPRQSSGESRYTKRRPNVGPRMVVDGIDLGPAIKPQDIFVTFRRLLDLEDDEIIRAFEIGRNRVAQDLGPYPVDPDMPALGDLSIDDRETAIAQTVDVSKSRLVAWRKRAREMTWLELRILFLGLHSVVLPEADDPPT